jgi:hypothetical protein
VPSVCRRVKPTPALQFKRYPQNTPQKHSAAKLAITGIPF